MMGSWWRTALGNGRTASEDQEDAIVAEPTGRRSVEAGAGTGKTSTLALRALYLIESDRVRADQIVVVTFTKKAAAEIASRIADTLDRAVDQGARFDTLGQGVRCTTIHALAADILREFAFEFGLVSAPRAISDGEAYGVFHESFAALLNREIDVDTNAFPVAEVNLETLERDLGKLALRLKNYGISPSDFATRGLAEAARFGKQTWLQLWTPSTDPKKLGRPISHSPRKPITNADLAKEAERDRANIAVVAALFDDFDRRLRHRGLATYGDLIGETARLLREHPTVVARLRTRFRYVLLDESQDTSALQLAFIETLFGTAADANAAAMMPVGDRRQAIYGFNGADEDVMERIATTADSTHALTVNRRSPQEIVDAGHAVLLRAEVIDASTPRLSASAGSGAMECIRLQNFEGGDIRERVGAEATAIAREISKLLRDATKPVVPSDIAILVRRRTHAAAYVRALNLAGVAAALDRRSGLFGADEVRDVLAWMSLLIDLSDAQAAVRIFQSPICGLNDATMIRLASDKEWLQSYLRDDFSARVDTDGYDRLNRVRTLVISLLPIASLPLSLAMETLLRTIPVVASYTRLGPSVGAQAIVNLRSFGLLADEFARDHPHARLSDFVADVKRRILYDDEPQEAELDLDGVRVMTIHQAKGLEWPYVFVACSTTAQYGTAGNTDALVAYDMASGAFALKNDVDGRETFRWTCVREEHDPQTGQRVALSRSKSLAKREQARVFYVAVTRARRRLYLTAPARIGSGIGSEAPYLGWIREWAQLAEPGIDLRFDVTTDSLTDTDVALKTVARPDVIGRIATPERPALTLFTPRISFTALSAFETCPRQARYRYRLLLPGLREQRSRYVGNDGTDGSRSNARLGTLTHAILEHWGASRLRGASPISLDLAFDRAALEYADLDEHEADDARKRATHAVAALAAFEIEAVEQKFELQIRGTIIEGAIDLVARSRHGVFHIIDYKTGTTDDEHYKMQLALYRHAYIERFGPTQVVAEILRLTPDDATLSRTRSVPLEELQDFVERAGALESDTATPGEWCRSCAYNDAPCRAAGPWSAARNTQTSTRPAERRVPADTPS